jgi:predicted DNA-binding ribbon-helix-helix protein
VGEAIAELERAQRTFLKNRGAADHDESVEIGRKGGGNETPMNNRITKRSIVIAGRKTSVSLEEPFWVSAKEIAALEEITVIKLVEQIHNRWTQQPFFGDTAIRSRSLQNACDECCE